MYVSWPSGDGDLALLYCKLAIRKTFAHEGECVSPVERCGCVLKLKTLRANAVLDVK